MVIAHQLVLDKAVLIIIESILKILAADYRELRVAQGLKPVCKSRDYVV